MQKKVYIITPAYNAADFITSTIESVLLQTYKNWNLVIVDDSSTDDTRDIVSNISKKESRIILLDSVEDRNLGPAHARNLGMDYALKHDADFLFFLDSDDTYEPTYLEKMLIVAEEYNADVVWCNYNDCLVEHKKEGKIVSHNLPFAILEPQEAMKQFFFQTSSLGSMWNKCYRASFINRYRIRLNEQRVRAEDWEFNLVLFDKKPRIVPIEDALYNYVHQERPSVMTTFRENDFELYKRSVVLLKAVASKWNLENYMHLVYENYVYNTICYLSHGLQTGMETIKWINVCKDNDLQDAIRRNNNSEWLTLKHRMYIFLIRMRMYSLLKHIMYYLR